MVAPERLVDITRLPLRGSTVSGDALVAGALTTMEELAAHPVLGDRAMFVREALLAKIPVPSVWTFNNGHRLAAQKALTATPLEVALGVWLTQSLH